VYVCLSLCVWCVLCWMYVCVCMWCVYVINTHIHTHTMSCVYELFVLLAFPPIIFNTHHLQYLSSSILIILNTYHLQYLPSSILIIFNTYHLQYLSSSILWPCSVLKAAFQNATKWIGWFLVWLLTPNTVWLLVFASAHRPAFDPKATQHVSLLICFRSL